MDLGVRGGRAGSSGGIGNCGRNVMYERRINKLKGQENKNKIK